MDFGRQITIEERARHGRCMWSMVRFVLWTIGHETPPFGLLRLLQVVGADGAAAPSCAIYDRQTRRAMLVEFSACSVKRLAFAAASCCRSHDLLDADFGSAPVISRHATTHVALSDDAD